MYLVVSTCRVVWCWHTTQVTCIRTFTTRWCSDCLWRRQNIDSQNGENYL